MSANSLETSFLDYAQRHAEALEVTCQLLAAGKEDCAREEKRLAIVYKARALLIARNCPRIAYQYGLENALPKEVQS